jgi:hypothetical protein
VASVGGVDVEVSGMLEEALDAIAADPKLAMDVIGEIASMTRWRGDPKMVEMCDETRIDLADTIAEAVGKRRCEEAARAAADLAALPRLAACMMVSINKRGDDEALSVLVAGLVELVADYLTEWGELIWEFGTTDDVLIDMAAHNDGRKSNLATGALDRARIAMRDAGWLLWKVGSDGFLYTLTPPENWRDWVRANIEGLEDDEPVQ